MSKHWTPQRPVVGIKGSRIRRDPAQVSRIRREPPPVQKKPVRLTDEQQTWFGVVGVLTIAAVFVALIVGVSMITIFKTPDAAVGRFDQCYNDGGHNCVLDGGTVYVSNEKFEIAGITAPAIENARCPNERERGIEAAVRLLNLLNSGPVTVGRPFHDDYGREVRRVAVRGEDAGKTLLDAGVVQKFKGKKRNWCG